MSSETQAPTGALINVSSYMNGNRMTETRAGNVADILKEQNISTTDVQIEILDLQGNQKPGRANTVLADGDTVQIMRKSNKSGTTTRNGVADIDIGVSTPVTMLYKIPTTVTTTRSGSRSKYRFHELNKKGTSFDVPFTPRSGKQHTIVLQRVNSAIASYRKTHRNKRFVTRLLLVDTKDRNFRTLDKTNTHTHVVRVWRSK
jgi:hypothetical protein